MMAMEITLDKDKIYSENTMDFKQMEYRINEILKENGITEKNEQGLFIGNNDELDFARFLKIIDRLEEQENFLEYVETWIFYKDDEKADLGMHYRQKRYTQDMQ